MPTAPREAHRRIAQNGFAIRAFREARGHSSQWLADAIDVSAPHLRNIENEFRSANNPTLARIARALDIPVAAIRRDPASDVEDVA